MSDGDTYRPATVIPFTRSREDALREPNHINNDIQFVMISKTQLVQYLKYSKI